MDIQIQARNLGRPNEEAQLTIRHPDGTMDHLPVTILGWSQLDEGNVKTIELEIPDIRDLVVERSE
jgi:hypothetical protein